jgi:F420-dependent oxidoreductase-like protein
MRFALMIEPQQGMGFADQLAVAQHAEAGGFETLFRSDHYSSFPGPQDNPTTDAWAALAGLARETTRIGLGTLVSPVTFRLPGNLAKVAATVDEMSGGRLEFGLGAGWNETEHRAYGLAFPPIADRADMLEEQLTILRGLWEEPDGWSFQGRHYQVEDALFRAKPVPRAEPRLAGRNGGIRLIVGGDGTPRSMRIAARLADEFNLSSGGPERVADRTARLDETCRAAGRDPASLTRSAMVGALIGADDAEVGRRTKELMRLLGAGSDSEAWLAERRKRWILGTPDQARAMVTRFADAGIERIMLQDFLPWDLDMIDLMAEELVGRV